MAKSNSKPSEPKRRANELRPIRIKRGFTSTAAGSVLFEMGNTKVLCTASFMPNDVPSWRKESGLGWVTADYSMLPASISPRKPRSKIGHTDSRGTEIQRLIGRTLRAIVDFEKLGENSIYLDCDVLQADGGTRTAAINGSYIALVDAVRFARKNMLLPKNPLTNAVAAISVGIIKGRTYLDLDYELDSTAEVDLNVAMTDDGRFVELQGTGEQNTFTAEQLESMLTLARKGIRQIFALQKKALK
jgi:ribonuclease PH